MKNSDSTGYRFLIWMALGTLALVVGTVAYQQVFEGADEGNLEYRSGNNRLEDGEFAEALAEFNKALDLRPRHTNSLLGRGQALMGLGKTTAALDSFDAAIIIDPDFAVGYANRGILLDRMGKHRAALEDYRQALALDASLADGPGWLDRFFRMQYDRPATIASRAEYLQAELQKPESSRLLRDPEVDAEQRSYKVRSDR